ncbi:ABC transporter ATP-binding protein [Parablautia intestinalis]|jgi:ABC-2 type transport system ATP-binding protein|uniref:ABC transporter ATP-binding protein n=1 Tax=Parablautia intestinalis TaxID=2320100 RepID=A0A3A9APC5_9FIRM|nr:ABC transporter ATP-binding protein [Parablautia intestinalis]MCI8616118.1 ABC transporter ATP-binding protein [Lachnospiraceae bacterium]RKI89381.1 ABC transporter ATP-binding protein [Parablautia intestinalis]
MELEIRDIQKRYGKKQVLKKAGLTAGKGQCTGIIGANGCGKSTLLRVLAGAEKADGGGIFLDGRKISNPSREMARYTGYIPQESVLMPELTVADNLKLWASFGDYRENLKRLADLSDQFRIKDFYKERVKNLSGGMEKRVNIVCALLHEPEILLMDEPSAALDLVFKQELKMYIRDFIQKGGSILLSSHDEGELSLCQNLWAIKEGETHKVPEGLSIEEITSKYIA